MLKFLVEHKAFNNHPTISSQRPYSIFIIRFLLKKYLPIDTFSIFMQAAAQTAVPAPLYELERVRAAGCTEVPLGEIRKGEFHYPGGVYRIAIADINNSIAVAIISRRAIFLANISTSRGLGHVNEKMRDLYGKMREVHGRVPFHSTYVLVVYPRGLASLQYGHTSLRQFA